MSKRGKKKPPDSRSRAANLSHPADAAQLPDDAGDSRGDAPDCRPAKKGQGSSPLSRYVVATVCGLLLLAVALVFAQTVRHDFINFDDDEYVYDNAQVARGFTAAGIVWAFTQFHSANWHPLTWLSHTLDCQLYGLKHPGGHHLTNVLLHAANAILLFLVLRQMSGGLWPSAFAAALFAVHPSHVESVAWVAERKDVLSGLFFLLTLAAYTGYARRPFSLRRYLLVTALFALGLMAKSMLVTLPFVLLLLDYWPLGRVQKIRNPNVEILNKSKMESRNDQNAGSFEFPSFGFGPSFGFRALNFGFYRCPFLLVEKLPWMALAAVSCVVTYSAQATKGAVWQGLPLPSRVAAAAVSYVAYLGQFLWPAELTVYYPHPQDALAIWKVFAAAALSAGICVVVLACHRRCPYLLVGWLWYLGMLVPVIGLVQVGSQAMADRYTYLTEIGLYMAIAWGAADLAGAWPSCCRPFAAVAALVMAGFMACAWQQTQHWHDSETLWTHTLAYTSENSIAHYNLAYALAGRGRLDEAIVHYQRALDIWPDDADAHNRLGNILAGRGQLEEAIGHYQRALEIRPNYAAAHDSLGVALASRGQVAAAIAEFQKALEIKPDHPAALNNLAWIRATHSDPRFRDGPQAVTLAQRAVELSVSDASALDTLAAAYAEAGRFAEAVQTAKKALDLAVEQGNPALAESIRAKLRLYAAGMPFHEPPSAPAKTDNRP